MKKIISMVLIFIVLGLSSLCTVFAEYGSTAKGTIPFVYVNGTQVFGKAFNMDGNNYFKLRDLAEQLNGTESQFDVIWNSDKGQVEIVTGQGYTYKGESSPDNTKDSYIVYPTASPILVDGKVIHITAFNVDNYNYFKLRDLAEIIPFYVNWVEEQNSIYITTQLSEGAHKAETKYQLSENGVSSNFTRWADTQNSYLIENNDGTISVIDINGHVGIETYDKSYNLIASKNIAFELPLFGAFYSGDKYNYIAYGQGNPNQKNSREVIRIVKYNKSFTRIGSVSILGGESYTILPFSGSGGRMAEKGNELIYHTTRTRYRTEDGLNHESQLTIILNTDTMKVLNDLGKFQPNHVSHSFDQFVEYDAEAHVLLDHGDGYPRSVVLQKQVMANEYNEVDLFKIPGAIGANFTGVSVGGFEISSNNYIAAINSIDHSISGKYTNFKKVGLDIDQRDVILCIVPKDKLISTEVKQVKITDYIGTDRYASIPKLVKIDEDKFMVLWQEILVKKGSTTNYSFGDLKYLTVDGSGKALGIIRTLRGGMLSKCNPILLRNQVVWYLNQKISRVFYTVPVD